MRIAHLEQRQPLIEGLAPPDIAGQMDFSTLKSHSGYYITAPVTNDGTENNLADLSDAAD